MNKIMDSLNALLKQSRLTWIKENGKLMQIKPLNWIVVDEKYYSVITSIGGFVINQYGAFYKGSSFCADSAIPINSILIAYFSGINPQDISKFYKIGTINSTIQINTIEEAKTKCEEHYMRMIMGCLEDE